MSAIQSGPVSLSSAVNLGRYRGGQLVYEGPAVVIDGGSGQRVWMTQGELAELLPLLQRFAETGTLAEDRAAERAVSDRVRGEIVEQGSGRRAVKLWVDNVEIGNAPIILGGYPPILLEAFDSGDLRLGDFLSARDTVVPERELFDLAGRRAAEREAERQNGGGL